MFIILIHGGAEEEYIGTKVLSLSLLLLSSGRLNQVKPLEP